MTLFYSNITESLGDMWFLESLATVSWLCLMLTNSMFFLIHWQTPSNFPAFAQYVWHFFSGSLDGILSLFFSNSLLSSHLLTSIFSSSLFCLLFSCYWLPPSIPRYSWSFRHLLLNNDITPAPISHLNTRSIFSMLYTYTWKTHRFSKLKMLKLTLILSLSEISKTKKYKNKHSPYCIFFLGQCPLTFLRNPRIIIPVHSFVH